MNPNLKLILGLIWTLILHYQISIGFGLDTQKGKDGPTPKQALTGYVKVCGQSRGQRWPFGMCGGIKLFWRATTMPNMEVFRPTLLPGSLPLWPGLFPVIDYVYMCCSYCTASLASFPGAWERGYSIPAWGSRAQLLQWGVAPHMSQERVGWHSPIRKD